MKNFFFIIATLIMTFNVYAHNEDKFGPHKGYIKMPGIFHTELVPEQRQSFKVYLLDVNIKNPTTENSNVTLSYEGTDGNKNPYKCIKVKDYFSCSVDSKTTAVDLNKGSLIVEASREGKKGNKAIYSLPLSLKGGMHH